MKVLILTGLDKIEKSNNEFERKFGTTNYLRELTIHGLRTLYGYNIVDYPKSWGSYDNEIEKRGIPRDHLWGKGFNIAGINKDAKDIDRTDIKNKISKRYFDLIIFSELNHSLELLEHAKNFNNKIIFLDGEDTNLIKKNLLNSGIYFKRELSKKNLSNIFPISFSIPYEKIATKIETNIENILSPLIPGINSTYKYQTENEYNDMYKKSIFGITIKKAGWDCYRHYELLMNGCLPFFLDIKDCPDLTCISLPKEKFTEINSKFLKKISNNYKIQLSLKKFPKLAKIILNLKRKFFKESDAQKFLKKNPEIFDIKNELLNFSKNNLTTENTAKRMISTINNFYK